MVFYTLIVSVFNLALGYALALCLQSRGIAPAWPRRILARLGLLNVGDDQADDRDQLFARATAAHSKPHPDGQSAEAAAASPEAATDHRPPAETIVLEPVAVELHDAELRVVEFSAEAPATELSVH